MEIGELAGRLEGLPGARIGRGPQHPEDPDPLIDNDLAELLSEYPALGRDACYVDFLKKYAGASIKNEDDTRIVDILGFSDASTEMLEMDGPIVDDDHFLLFAQCVFYTITDGKVVDMYEYDFAFDSSGERPPGVYRCAATPRSLGGPYVWYTTNFCSWLAELIDKGGYYERPELA